MFRRDAYGQGEAAGLWAPGEGDAGGRGWGTWSEGGIGEGEWVGRGDVTGKKVFEPNEEDLGEDAELFYEDELESQIASF